jgi:hypothetical protein
MAIELLTEWFGARVGSTKATAIRLYCAEIGKRPTEMVREAIDEYMAAHPAPEQPSE